METVAFCDDSAHIGRQPCDARSARRYDVKEASNNYNAREHSVLRMRPIDRFGLDLARIRFLPPSDVSDELFFVEQERKVLADNTFSLQGSRYEAPRDLRSRKIQVRFNRRAPDRVAVYYKGERMGEARPVDFVANDRKPPRGAGGSR